MADWFKFYNDGLDSNRMQFAISEQPLVTGVWLVILSEASKARSSRIIWSDKDFELMGMARKINVSVPILNQCIGLLERAEYIKRAQGVIEILDWERMQSDYARGLDKGYYKKTSNILASNSEVSTVRGEERRVEENRVQEKRRQGDAPLTHGNASVTPANAIQKQKNNKSTPVLALIERIFTEWNTLSMVPQCLLVSSKRRLTVEARLRDKFFYDNWNAAMFKVKDSMFCRGQNNSGWKASFDWFIQPDSVLKLMEGKYDGKADKPSLADKEMAALKRDAERIVNEVRGEM